ncbi:hypothetical protein TrispH2_009276 [Trichoplax sp. H2]|nr:hypothetical protein TrispH2_009276 [Trichoplax sp. H2]|eukprot:RDD38129.1 hypothetical protein TrispH2_009276 [Trichoplax sp. H2]
MDVIMKNMKALLDSSEEAILLAMGNVESNSGEDSNESDELLDESDTETSDMIGQLSHTSNPTANGQSLMQSYPFLVRLHQDWHNSARAYGDRDNFLSWIYANPEPVDIYPSRAYRDSHRSPKINTPKHVQSPSRADD